MQDVRDLVAEVALSIPIVDQNTTEVTYPRDKSKPPYLQGMATMPEYVAVPEIVQDIAARNVGAVVVQGCEVRFQQLPHGAKKYPRCDAVLTVAKPSTEDWAIEFKRIQFLGDNGKNNDYGFQKLFSPYLKDRSLLHDCSSLAQSGLGDRRFVVGWSFRHSLPLLNEALSRHPQHADRVQSARKVCALETNSRLDPEVGVEMVNAFLHQQGLVQDFASAPFTGAWRHPIGGDGLVFGWELTPAH